MYAGKYYFYGEEAQSQGSLIPIINKDFVPPIPEITSGMCYMLAIQFILDYLPNCAEALPETTFDRITGDYAYLRQIAGNFRKYIMDAGTPFFDIVPATERYVEMLSEKRSEAKLLTRFDTRSIPQPLIDNPARGHLVIFYFTDPSGKKTFGHAVAVVRDQDTYCLYDPNFGIFRTKNPDDIYAGVLPNIYNPKYINGSIFSINKKKLD